MWGLELGDVDTVIERALHEDLASSDVTTHCTVPAVARANAEIVAKAALTVCGLGVAAAVFARVDSTIVFQHTHEDGDAVQAGTVVGRVTGRARSILAAERTALNFMQRMSGTATLARHFVDAAAGRCRIVDTRKTTPGLRALQRYAVRCGGADNHRNDLGSGVLIKENHIRAAGSITAAVTAAKQRAPHLLKVECEVTSQDEVRAALAAGADVLMLDNMDDAQVAQAVAEVAGRALVEASGNVTLERIDRLAALGVDLISAGALTHSAPAADLSLIFAFDEASLR